MAKTTQKLTKAEIDAKVLRLLEVDEKVKALNKELKDLKISLESQYELGPDQKEIILGVQTIVEKVSIDKGANQYNTEKLKPWLKGVRGALSKVIKRVEMVNVEELNKLVKEGKIPSEVLDVCRENKWTFKSMFKRIEAIAQKPAKSEKTA